MRKRIVITALSMLLATATVVPAYAAEPMKWNIDPNTYNEREHGGINWMLAESIEATKVWAEGYRAQLESIPTNMDKFNTIATIVTDFLSYDLEYRTLVDNYTYRDGKGVCEDYARSVMALCQVAGLPCTYEIGNAYGDGHAWNKVTIDGIDYFSDLTGYESSGDKSLWLSTTLWSDHTYKGTVTDLDGNTVANSINRTTVDGGTVAEPGSGLTWIKTATGKTVWITQQDGDAFDQGLLTLADLKVKYPELLK